MSEPSSGDRRVSAETVAAARLQWERFLADDIPGTLAFLDPEVEIHDDPAVPDAGVYRGHAGYLAQIARWREAFDDLAWKPVEIFGRGDKTVAEVQCSGTAKGSHLPGKFTYFEVLTWRDGKVARVDYRLSREGANAAAT